MADMITQTPEPVTVRPQRSIGTFTTMVVVEEQGTDDLEITEHPVQEGAVIADHAFLKPVEVSIKAVFGDDEMPLSEIYERLLRFQNEREPFDVVTGKRIYKNMLLKSIGVTTDRTTENILAVTFTCKEVIIVTVEVATVPPRAKHKQAGTSGTQKAGAKSAKEDKASPQKQKSILKSISAVKG